MIYDEEKNNLVCPKCQSREAVKGYADMGWCHWCSAHVTFEEKKDVEETEETV